MRLGDERLGERDGDTLVAALRILSNRPSVRAYHIERSASSCIGSSLEKASSVKIGLEPGGVLGKSLLQKDTRRDIDYILPSKKNAVVYDTLWMS